MDTHTYQKEHGAAKGSIFSYSLGFIFSIALTLVAFSLVYVHIVSDHDLISHTMVYNTLIGCAVIQLFTQIFFFLHVGKESKTHWNITALIFALIVVAILVGGTLWIMSNLEHENPHGIQEPFENGVVTPQTEN